MQRFNNLIEKGVKESFSDIHISGDHKIICRKNGKIIYLHERYSCEQIDSLVKSLLRPHEMDMLRNRLSVDLSRTIQHIRVRINVFNSSRGLSLAVRLLPGKIPNFNDLNLPSELREYCAKKSGLILVCGATGAGKSSTIAAFLAEISRTQNRHIVTLEDPIEYRFKSENSFIQQRELGAHMTSYEQGLLDVLREDPDVIMVGELREPETIRLTLNAVEAGHLVIASLHATNSEDALYRMCNSFPPEAQDMVRLQLSSVLSLLLVQKLEYKKEYGFRVPLLSILKGQTSVKSVIRDNRFSQIENIIQTGRREGLYTMERYEQEFLGSSARMTPPSISFRPSMEMAEIRPYQSPLLNPEATYMYNYNSNMADYGSSGVNGASPSGVPQADVARHTGVVHQPGFNHSSGSQNGYVINESSSVEDVINLL